MQGFLFGSVMVAVSGDDDAMLVNLFGLAAAAVLSYCLFLLGVVVLVRRLLTGPPGDL